MKRYEVQEFTICDGWINNWSFEYDNGEVQKTTFDSVQQARSGLLEFLKDMAEEVEAGNMEDSPEFDDFRIVEVKE